MNFNLEKIETLRKKILENSHELLEDALLLLKNKRWARAFCLTQLASEELAKLLMLHTAAIHLIRGKEFDFKTLNKRMNSHYSKILNIIVLENALTSDDNEVGPKTLREFITLKKRFYNFKRLAKLDIDKKAKEFNNLKNNSLYTQVINDQILKPSEIITEQMATEYFKKTVERIEFIEILEMVNRDDLKNKIKDWDFSSLDNLTSINNKKI